MSDNPTSHYPHVKKMTGCIREGVIRLPVIRGRPCADLITRTWVPTGPIYAKLVLVHGFGEQMKMYDELLPDHLATRGIMVYGFDQRGFGRTLQNNVVERGRTGPTWLVLSDLVAVIEESLAEAPRPYVQGYSHPHHSHHPSPLPNHGGGVAGADLPLFVMGHSMGGAEILTLASDPAYADLVGRVRGWILESPFLDFVPSARPPWSKVFFGKMASKLLPNKVIDNPIALEDLTRDSEALIRMKDYYHTTGTLEGLAGLLDRSARLRSGRARLLTAEEGRGKWKGKGKDVDGDGAQASVQAGTDVEAGAGAGAASTSTRGGVQSLILFHGTEDRIASYDASKAWYDAYTTTVPDREFRTIEGGFHMLHADWCRKEFQREVADWVLTRAGQSTEWEEWKSTPDADADADDAECEARAFAMEEKRFHERERVRREEREKMEREREASLLGRMAKLAKL